jgi:hypothetical protein
MSGLCGVKVAIVPVAASRTTDAATTAASAGAGPVTVNVAEFTVVASMRSPAGTRNVALMAAAGHTLDSPAEGLVDSTEITAAGLGAAVTKVHT